MPTVIKGKSIVLVTNSTWNIFNFRQTLIKKFLDQGFEVSVIAPVDEYIHYKEKYPDVRHYNLRFMDRDGMNPFKDILLIFELIIWYRKISPDVVIHFTNKPNIYGAIASWIAKVKSIGVVTGLGYAFINNGFAGNVMSWLYRRTGKFHNKIIFENMDDRLLFIKMNIINEQSSVSIKGCGVDTQYFKPEVDQSPVDKIVFTFIGRLLYDKGIREFVAAARVIRKSNPNIEFWVVGELDTGNPSTVNRDELVEWVDEGIIYYHGFLKDIHPVIAKSDCIVLPSYREGLPRTIIEAMSMGKPVITTDTAGCRETVDDGINGYLVIVKSVDSLVQAINRMSQQSEAARTEMGKKGREKAVSEFDHQIIADKIYEVVIQTCCTKRV